MPKITKRPYVTPFPNGVVHVVGLGSEEQMIRAHARWIVTVVKDEQSIRDGSKVDFPGDTMGFL